MAQKRVLILGGAGFLGSHLAERLIHDGHRVTVFDNMKYCYPDNLAAQKKNKNLTVIEGDVIEMPANVLFGDYDEIYHMAGLVSTEDFLADPLEAFWVSVQPMQDLLEMANLGHPVPKLLFTSSSEVYGNTPNLPTQESDLGQVDMCGPRGGYDEGKRAAETLITSWASMHNTKCARVRIFNTFGPRMRANGRLVPSMIKDALEHGVITVNKPGTFTRTLLYVDDCVDALILAMEAQHYEPINIGGKHQQMIVEIAAQIREAVESASGSVIKIDYGPELTHDIRLRQPDISRAKELLGWEPYIWVKIGIRATVDYWMARVKNV